MSTTMSGLSAVKLSNSAIKSSQIFESPKIQASLRTKNAEQASFAQSFAQIVAVLMRDPRSRMMRLAELERLVLPPVMLGQFALAHTSTKAPTLLPSQNEEKKRANGNTIVPVAVALWACVSDKLDKMLSDPLLSQPKLQLADWSSGDCLWLMSVAGDPRALPTFLDQLGAKEFKGRRAKVRVRGPDGKVSIKMVGRAA